MGSQIPKQLLLCKRLFIEASLYMDRQDSVSRGIAISLLQDSAEMLVWTLIKERNIGVKDRSGFKENLETLEKNGIKLSHTPKISELNAARVNFKHYGNLPAPEETPKFHAYTEAFLRDAFSDHFGQSYEGLSLADLVATPEVRSLLKEAEKHLIDERYDEVTITLAYAKEALFKLFESIIPAPDHHIRDHDSVLSKASDSRGIRVFSYLGEYLTTLRLLSLAALFRIPITDFVFLREFLPPAYKTGDGKWHVGSTLAGRCRYERNRETCQRASTVLVNIALQMEMALKTQPF